MLKGNFFMKKVIFIYNPWSGDHSISLKLEFIIKTFQERGILIQPFRIHEKCDESLLNILKNNNYEYVVVSGGDGTLNFVINLLLKNGLDLPIGVVPSGTSNDFARCINLPISLDECLNIILSGKTIEVDAGLINNEKYFLSTCAGGVFVGVSFNTHSELKKNFGPFAYYLKALSELTNIKSFRLKIETETKTIEEEALLFLILNGKHAAGFYNLIKDADLSDGIMDIVLIKSCNHIDLASLFFKVLSNDVHKDKNVMKLKAKSCRIEGNTDVNLSIDGEKGEGLPIDVKFINKALKVFIS